MSCVGYDIFRCLPMKQEANRRNTLLQTCGLKITNKLAKTSLQLTCGHGSECAQKCILSSRTGKRLKKKHCLTFCIQFLIKWDALPPCPAAPANTLPGRDQQTHVHTESHSSLAVSHLEKKKKLRTEHCTVVVLSLYCPTNSQHGLWAHHSYLLWPLTLTLARVAAAAAAATPPFSEVIMESRNCVRSFTRECRLNLPASCTTSFTILSRDS